MKKDITSFFNNSKYHMADITKKAASFRRAITMGSIHVGKVGFSHIKNETLPKGDVLKLAEIAGVQGAKNAWQQIPMCHPLLLDHVAIYLELDEKSHSITAYAIVSTTAKTGVEMEALAAVNAALLTLYDLTKPVEPALEISGIRLLIKEGGKKGLWVHPNGIPDKLRDLLPAKSKRPLEGINASVITLSDRAYKGEYEDKSGIALKEGLEFLGCEISNYEVLPDEADQLEKKLRQLIGKTDLIITTGGTGLSKRDITPQTVKKLGGIEIDGIGELLRSSSAAHVVGAYLSRSIALNIDGTLLICLPGSTGAVKDALEVLKPILAHAIAHLQGKKHIHDTKKTEE